MDYDQLMRASLFPLYYYWYDVGICHARRIEAMDQTCEVANPARGQLNRENDYFPVPVRARELGRARQVRPSRPGPSCSFSTFRLNSVLTHVIPPAFRDYDHKGVNLCVQYLCMVITYSRVWINQGMVANPARGKLNMIPSPPPPHPVPFRA